MITYRNNQKWIIKNDKELDQEDKTYLQITAFYPLDKNKPCDLSKFELNDVIQVEGRFLITENDKNDGMEENNLIKDQEDKTYLQITAFYPLDKNKPCDLSKFELNDVIQVEGRFLITENDKNDGMEENNLIKVLASNIVVLNLESVNMTQVTVRTNIKEYFSEKEIGAINL
ncbi:hypothetical protein Glove_165g19 [Diversispora epigaea]|uniref:Uncharacterized protein n=1 Tax=Diversispora epigaea TaxID=1348612 RepID=A0A397IQY7_9GLOM|nr:hypothetical protein Glove_165g19 [Diversispora epigaea]